MNMLKWILIGLAAVAVIVAVIMLVPVLSAMLRPDKHIIDGDGMVNETYLKSVTYSEAGDMSGGSVYMKLYSDEAGKVWLEVSERADAGSEEVSNTYELDRNAIYEFNALYDEKHMGRCVDLPDSELLLLDAAICSVRIEFSDRTIKFDSTNEFPEECIGAVGAVYSLLQSFIPVNDQYTGDHMFS